MKEIISKRLNAYGLKEISIAIQGEDQMVVQLPGTDEQSVGHIKRQVESAGKLEFRLVASAQEQTPERQKPVYTIHAEGRSAGGAVYALDAITRLTRDSERPYVFLGWKRGSRRLFDDAADEDTAALGE